MSDNTARLGLPEIAQMQEMTSAQINDALLQLDALCSPSVLGLFVNDPPPAPIDGDTYVTGGAPTGAWAGFPYKIAYCVDGGWRMFTPFDGLVIHRADGGSFAVYLDGQWTGLGAMLAGPEIHIASAATCDLGAAGGLRVQITGTTTITSLGTGVHALRLVRFTGALTLTHNATSLILPGGIDIATRPDDCAVFASDGSGNWRCCSYARADGRMVNMNSPVFTGTLTGPDAGYWDNAGIRYVKTLIVQDTQASGTARISARNASDGTGAVSELMVFGDDWTNGSLRRLSSGYDGSGLYAPGSTQLVSGTGQLAILTSDESPILFGVNNAQAVTINGTGIGWNITPAYPLHVHSTAPIMARFEGSAGTNQAIVMSSGAGYMLYLELVDGEAGKFRIGKDSGNAFFIYDVANGENAFHISSAGQMDLASPSGQSIRAVAGGSGGVQLTGGATAWATISERHRKKDFTRITDALGRIRAHAVELWRYRTDPEDAPLRAGLFYEDAEKWWPVAAQKDADGKGLVASTAYVPLLMAGVQALERRVIALEEKLTLRETAFRELFLRVCRLETQVGKAPSAPASGAGPVVAAPEA